MIRTRLLLVVLVVSTAAHAAPLPKAIKGNRPEPLAGTTWVGDESPLGRIQYTFEDGGQLTVTYVSNGAVYTKSTWTQTGTAIYWECNDKYVEYHATLKDGRISGEALNVKGLRWAVSLSQGKER